MGLVLNHLIMIFCFPTTYLRRCYRPQIFNKLSHFLKFYSSPPRYVIHYPAFNIKWLGISLLFPKFQISAVLSDFLTFSNRRLGSAPSCSFATPNKSLVSWLHRKQGRPAKRHLSKWCENISPFEKKKYYNVSIINIILRYPNHLYDIISLI